MAGEFKCTSDNSIATQTADSRLAKSFSEGRYALIYGGYNPHVIGSKCYNAWQAYSVQVKVDPKNTIAETTGSNNSFTKSIVVP